MLLKINLKVLIITIKYILIITFFLNNYLIIQYLLLNIELKNYHKDYLYKIY